MPKTTYDDDDPSQMEAVGAPMTKGSWIHEEVSRHFRACSQCRDTEPEAARLRQQGLRHTRGEDAVPAAVLAKMCVDGCAIYRAYLDWLAEPSE